ncbi:hypothetical protein [Paenibacillus wulumuqiensis]|uniref:hypothetical protein n=1 Tax=Paenibacillus wulumuqiensis TaxID=1567107 RepID=UPI0006195AE0|nr:hypothetical protein [Paenibacillus wulumuqiensis]
MTETAVGDVGLWTILPVLWLIVCTILFVVVIYILFLLIKVLRRAIRALDIYLDEKKNRL